MDKCETRLRFFLRTLGVLCTLAIIPLLLPVSCLDRAHRLMGLGPFPSAPIAEYLARSVCSLCAFYGGLLLVLARDVHRFVPIIIYQAIAILVLSTFGIFAGVRANLPFIWPLADAAGCWLFLLPILVLARRVARNQP